MNLKILATLLLASILVGCATTTITSADGTQLEVGMSDAAKLHAANLNIALGMSYLSQNYTDLAKRKLLKAIDLAPDLPEAHAALAYYYAQVKDIPAAQLEYQRALRLGPDDPTILNSYGVFLCGNQQYQAANSYFMKAIAEPSYTEVGSSYLNAGLCALQQDNTTVAEIYLIKAIQQNPKLALAYLQLAKMRFAEGQHQAAQQYLDQYNNNAQASPESLQLAIALATQAGDNNRVASLRLLLQAKFPNQVLGS